MAVDEERLREHLDDREVRTIWGIPMAARWARFAGAAHFVALAAMCIALIAYLIVGDQELVNNRLSGLIIVVLLVFAVSILRFFQIRKEKEDLADFKKALARSFTGEDQHDIEAQLSVEASYVWPSRHLSVLTRMAGVTAFIILIINTYQIGNLDLFRTIVFDLGIVTYLAGSLWNNFSFKEALLEAELEERLRASLQYRDAHPELFEQEEDGWTDKDIDFSGSVEEPEHKNDSFPPHP